jgi:hypothetical protein
MTESTNPASRSSAHSEAPLPERSLGEAVATYLLKVQESIRHPWSSEVIWQARPPSSSYDRQGSGTAAARFPLRTFDAGCRKCSKQGEGHDRISARNWLGTFDNSDRRSGYLFPA